MSTAIREAINNLCNAKGYILHGYVYVEGGITPPGAYILIQRSDPHTPFVVWFYNSKDRVCHAGYYEKTLTDGWKEFLNRAQASMNVRLELL